MILDDIVSRRKEQLEREISNISRSDMKAMAKKCEREPLDFYNALSKPELSVIAEVKKASPSRSVIQPDFHPSEQAVKYEKAGADAISCLTEEYYFQGSREYLKDIREKVSIPVLRKDFIIDEYQIYEARVIGADAILLIAAILDKETMRHFAKTAGGLGLQCLFEAHDEEEVRKILECSPRIIGINNRNLKTFEVSLDNTSRLAAKIPEDCIIVSESGIKTHDDMVSVKKSGADAVLIGETLMRSGNIADTMKELRKNI